MRERGGGRAIERERWSKLSRERYLKCKRVREIEDEREIGRNGVNDSKGGKRGRGGRES